MSSQSFRKIDQKEYLKKYLSGDKGKKKKKDKKHKKYSAASSKVKIIDDDINHLDTGVEIDEDLLLAGEDAPQIVAEYIEEKPPERKVPKWKSIVIKDEPEDENYSQEQNEADLWGRKRGRVKIEQEFDMDKNHASRTADISPPRRKHRNLKNSPRRSYNSSERAAKIKTEPLSPQCSKYDQSSARRQYRRSKSIDISPPRRKNSKYLSPKRSKSPTRYNRKRSPDQSPPRRRINSDLSPQRRCKSPLRYSRDFDQTPPRSSKNLAKSSPRRRRDFNQSPQELSRRKSPFRSPNRRRDSDQSPPRIIKKLDPLPPRRRRESYHSPSRKTRNPFYQSPPRKDRQRVRTPDNSPPRKGRKTPDQSPPRRKQHLYQSPPRKARSPDRSPSSRKKKSLIESHKSLTHIKREKRTPDLSPRPRHSRSEQLEFQKNYSPPPTHKPKSSKTLDGKKAGLQDAKALKKETLERRKQEDLLFERMSSEISGRAAEVQVRSTGRKGRRAREAAQEDPEERRRKEEHEEKKKLLYDRWGKGLKQIEDHKKRMQEHEYESSKPLARYSNDEDLERHLKEQERAEDPMLEYMRQKRKEKEKQSGKPQTPRYEGPYPENRFGIRPGYRWDGVDRSNGYEKKYFNVQNEKRARQDEAYKYSVEDM